MEIKTIVLTQNQRAQVDIDDYKWLNKYKWHFSNGYAVRKTKSKHGKRKTVYMHRAILEHHGHNMAKLFTDHADRNRLNNRKTNLRPATCQESARNCTKTIRNTSGYIGVHWHKDERKWYATIKIGANRKKHLGAFANKLNAAYVYDQAAKEFHGKFATLNFPEETEK